MNKEFRFPDKIFSYNNVSLLKNKNLIINNDGYFTNLNSTDLHPTHYSLFGIGGHRTLYEEEITKENLVWYFKEDGMTIYENATGKLWLLNKMGTVSYNDDDWEYNYNVNEEQWIELPVFGYSIVEDLSALADYQKKIGMIVYNGGELKLYKGTSTDDDGNEVDNWEDLPKFSTLTGTLKIKDSDDEELGTFAANQKSETVITLPSPPAVNDGKLSITVNGETTDFTANSSTDKTVNITIPTIPTIPAPANDATITIKVDGNYAGSFTTDQASLGTIDIKQNYTIVDLIEDLPYYTDPTPQEKQLGHGMMGFVIDSEKVYIRKWINKNNTSAGLEWVELKTGGGDTNITVAPYKVILEDNSEITYPAILNNGDPIVLLEGNSDEENKKQIELTLDSIEDKDSTIFNKLNIKISEDFILRQGQI
jgi:hypothetical protein